MTSTTLNLHDFIDSVICMSTFACLAIDVRKGAISMNSIPTCVFIGIESD